MESDPRNRRIVLNPVSSEAEIEAAREQNSVTERSASVPIPSMSQTLESQPITERPMRAPGITKVEKPDFKFALLSFVGALLLVGVIGYVVWTQIITKSILKTFEVAATDISYSIDYYSDAKVDRLGLNEGVIGPSYSYTLVRPDEKLSLWLTQSTFNVDNFCNKPFEKNVATLNTEHGKTDLCVAEESQTGYIIITIDAEQYGIFLSGTDLTKVDWIKSDLERIVTSIKIK